MANQDHGEVDGTGTVQDGRTVLRWLAVAGLIYVLIVAVSTVGAGFRHASGDRAEELFEFATNPFLGLLVGMVATALTQSSSTVTSIIVGLVAGGLPVAVAVPMVMGANVGTTITNTIVSLGHIGDKAEFRRAFSAATVHDFFNLLSVVVFLPLEMAFGLLERLGGWLSSLLAGGGSMSIDRFNVLKAATKPVVGAFELATRALGDTGGGVVMVALGIGLIFVAITLVGRLLRKLMVGRARRMLHAAIGRGPLTGIFSGAVVTVLVQSSSTTTSLAVPLAGSGTFGLRQIYPFTLGANIGTCVTALLAATAISDGTASAALQIAVVHLLYNLFGVVVIFGIKVLRELPVKGAEALAAIAAERKALALAYIAAVFFLIPGVCVGVSRLV